MNCPYKDIFGIPNQGFHAQRFLGFALNDTLGTIVLAVLVSYTFKIGFWKTLLWTFVIGEFLHYLFGVQTAFLRMMGISVRC